MFILSRIEDCIPVPPSMFAMPLKRAVVTQLNSKYCNRLIPQLGLCVRIWDLVTCSDPIVVTCGSGSSSSSSNNGNNNTISVQEGSYEVKVQFRIIVFRPFVGEVIQQCRIAESDRSKGIVLHMSGLVPQRCIQVPPEFFNQDTFFDERDGGWCWWYEGEKMQLDTRLTGDHFKFRLVDFHFNGPSTAATCARSAAAIGGADSDGNQKVASDNVDDDENMIRLTGAINEPGLGCWQWWHSAETDGHLTDNQLSSSLIEQK